MMATPLLPLRSLLPGEALPPPPPRWIGSAPSLPPLPLLPPLSRSLS